MLILNCNWVEKKAEEAPLVASFEGCQILILNCSCVEIKAIRMPIHCELQCVNSVLAALEPRRCLLRKHQFFGCQILILQLCRKKTKSAFSQTRYTDSVLASLEPRLFHSKWLNTLKLILLFLNSYGRSCFLNSKPIIINDCTFTFKYNVEFLSASYSCSRFYIFKILLFLFLFFSDLSNWNNFILLEQFYSFGITLFFWNNFILLE